MRRSTHAVRAAVEVELAARRGGCPRRPPAPPSSARAGGGCAFRWRWPPRCCCPSARSGDFPVPRWRRSPMTPERRRWPRPRRCGRKTTPSRAPRPSARPAPAKPSAPRAAADAPPRRQISCGATRERRAPAPGRRAWRPLQPARGRRQGCRIPPVAADAAAGAAPREIPLGALRERAAGRDSAKRAAPLGAGARGVPRRKGRTPRQHQTWLHGAHPVQLGRGRRIAARRARGMGKGASRPSCPTGHVPCSPRNPGVLPGREGWPRWV